MHPNEGLILRAHVSVIRHAFAVRRGGVAVPLLELVIALEGATARIALPR